MLRGLNWLIEYAFSLLRVFSILLIALFLPQLYLWHMELPQGAVTHRHTSQFKLGIENLSDRLLKWVKIDQNGVEPTIGLITNQTGTDQEGTRNVDILAQKGLIIKKILMPQGSNYKIEPSLKNPSIAKIPVIVGGGLRVLKSSLAKKC